MTNRPDSARLAADLVLAVLEAGGSLTVPQAVAVIAVLTRSGWTFTRSF